MRLLIFLLVLTTFSTHAAQHIPLERTFPEAWQSAGYPGEIPAPAKILNVRDFGAVGNGIANDQSAIVATMNALSNSPGVVYFPAGSYLMNGIIRPTQGAVFRGERSENTSIIISNDIIFYPFFVTTNQPATYQPVVSGYEIHSSILQVTDGSVFAPGDYAQMQADTDPAWGSGGWANIAGQILRIAAVNGNAITLVNPLRLTYKSSLNPRIRKAQMIKNVGFENLRFVRVPTSATPSDRNNKFDIAFDYAADCWVRGIESTNCFGAAVGVLRSTQVEITGSYIHHAYEVDGGGSGYGVRLEFYPGECLVENNIFRSLRHAMVCQAGPNGNVFGYNYSREATRTEFPADASGDIVLHGNYPFANLFEGNICQHIWPDNSHTANGPFNTFVRNRAEYAGINVTDTACTNLNLVGNETYTGSSLIQLFIGDGWRLQGSGNFAYGNNTQSDGIQSPGTTSLTDYSYYLNDDPSVLPPLPVFWNITNEFPSIGLPLARTAVKEIPARARYFAGGSLTVGPPSLAKQPTNFTATACSTATFSVQATGTPFAVYTWFKDGIALADQTNATAIINTPPEATGNYTCLISDGTPYSVRSAPATLMIAGFSLSSGGANVGVDGGSGLSVGLSTANVTCPWIVTTDVPWISNLSPTSGLGSGVVTFAVAANASSSIRTGHVIVAGQTYTVTQAPCNFSLIGETTVNSPVDGLSFVSFSFNSTGTACTWVASADVPWITGLIPLSGSGDANLSCAISVNPHSTPRTGHIIVGELTYTVNQLGAVSSFNDGVPDWWREEYFGTAGTTNSQSCATCDATGTGQNNLFKYVAGLDPTNTTAVFNLTIAPVVAQPNQINLAFGPIASERTYTAAVSTNLNTTIWNDLTPISGPVTNGNQITITDLDATGPAKFYHIHISYP